ETVGTVLLFGGFRQALLTFYQQADGEAERRRVVSSTLVLVLGSCLGGGALALALSPALGAWLAPLVPGRAALGPGLLSLAVPGGLRGHNCAGWCASPCPCSRAGCASSSCTTATASSWRTSARPRRWAPTPWGTSWRWRSPCSASTRCTWSGGRGCTPWPARP